MIFPRRLLFRHGGKQHGDEILASVYKKSAREKNLLSGQAVFMETKSNPYFSNIITGCSTL
jgi:hypothetical protein